MASGDGYSLFGFEIRRKKENVLPSFTPQLEDDGAVVVAATGSSYGTYLDLDGTVRTEAELVAKYREMVLQPEIDSAIDEVTNEVIVLNDERPIVTIVLDNVKGLSSAIKKNISEEFDEILRLLEFTTHAYEVFRRWYTDGRLYYHVIIDPQKIKEGIKELRYVDPRKIRKIKEVSKKQHNATGVLLQSTVNEYYLYNEKGFNYGNKTVTGTTTGIKISKDSIVHVTSGLTDANDTMVLSYIHKGIKPLNQLRALEDSVVIYRISRAPERRIFYIDVGNLPKMKAEQYLRDVMIKHKNRLVYNAESGQVRDDRKFMTMLEDYWFPRREGSKGTEIVTLPAGQNLGQMEDVDYFKDKLYRALNVPLSRLMPDQAGFNIGRSAEITRDEVKFARFVDRIRLKFSSIFLKILEKQLILKGVMTIEDWEKIQLDIKFDFARDSYFEELKEIEIFKERLSAAAEGMQFVNKYYSHKWLRKNILRQDDEEILEQDNLILSEINNQILNPPEIDNLGDGNVSPSDQQDDDESDQGLQNNPADPDRSKPNSNQPDKIKGNQ